LQKNLGGSGTFTFSMKFLDPKFSSKEMSIIKYIKVYFGMPNYQNSKLYKIWSPQTNEVYVGSTTQPLSRRMVGHRGAFKRYKAGKTNYVSSFKILEYGDARIELIRECPCDNREQLVAIEGKHIRELDCVNIIIAGRTWKQYRQDNKDKIKAYREANKDKNKAYREANKDKIRTYMKEYREANKEAIRAKVKEYHQANKDKIKAYYQDNKEAIRAKQKEYRQDNKEAIRAKQKEYQQKNKEVFLTYAKEYREANKDKIAEKRRVKIQCDCGSIVTKGSLKQHQRSAKHKRLIGKK